MKDCPELPRRNEVHLWVCGDLLSSRLDEALAILDPEEQKRARAFHFENDRRRYLGGTLLQRDVLSRYLSCSMRELSFLRNEWGKPSLSQRHDSTIQFSLSRSHEIAILAVSREREVGVDLEYEFGRVRGDLSIMSLFSEAEQESIENAIDSTRAFFEIWARKEAYIKGIGRGLSHPLEKFDVGLSGSSFVRDWAEESIGELWNVQPVKISQEGYAAALATPFVPASIEMIGIKSGDLLEREDPG